MDNRIYANLHDLTLLKHQAYGFSFLPKQPAHSILSGRHASRLRGRGLNFEELRHYRPGDDIRTMDWKVTNRTRKPHVRVYTEERDRSSLLIVDQRISMFFGSENKMKYVVAAEIAALGGWRILSVGDRIGALVFNDKEIKEIKPQRSSKTMLQILHHIVRFNHALRAGQSIAHDKQQLNRTLKEAERLCGHDYLITIISDLSGWSEETIKRIKRLTQHNDIIVSLIYDPLEKTLPDSDHLLVSDGEMQIEISHNKKVKEEYTQEFISTVEYLQTTLKKYSVPVIPLHTMTPVQEQIRQIIGDKMRSQRK